MPMTPAQTPRMADQADGLRRIFEAQRAHCIAVAANDFAGPSAPYLDALAQALIAKGLAVLIVDAADSAPAANEWLEMDLALSVERLGPRLGYLAAPMAARRYVDTNGSAQRWLKQVQASVPWAQAIILHASARDLARLRGAGASTDWMPVLISGRDQAAITETYAAFKLLHQRCGVMSADILVGADPQAPPGLPDTLAVAKLLDACADNFLGGSIRCCAAVDVSPSRTAAGTASAGADLLALAALQLTPLPEPAPMQHLPTGLPPAEHLALLRG